MTLENSVFKWKKVFFHECDRWKTSEYWWKSFGRHYKHRSFKNKSKNSVTGNCRPKIAFLALQRCHYFSNKRKNRRCEYIVRTKMSPKYLYATNRAYRDGQIGLTVISYSTPFINSIRTVVVVTHTERDWWCSRWLCICDAVIKWSCRRQCDLTGADAFPRAAACRDGCLLLWPWRAIELPTAAAAPSTANDGRLFYSCLLYTSPSPRD